MQLNSMMHASNQVLQLGETLRYVTSSPFASWHHDTHWSNL